MNPIVKQIIEIPVFWLHCLRTNMCLQHSRDLNPWERKGWELPLTPYPLQHPVIWKLVTQSCLALHNPLDYSLPGSSVHEILQARILEWVIVPFSRGSSWCRDQTRKALRFSLIKSNLKFKYLFHLSILWFNILLLNIHHIYVPELC